MNEVALYFRSTTDNRLGAHMWSLRRIALLAFLLSAAASGANGPPPGNDFWLIPELESHKASNGMVMICPAHRHGDPLQAMGKLHDRLQALPADRVSSIWVCRTNPLSTLERFAPTVHQVIINPFALSSTRPPRPETTVWPGIDHPWLNHLRQLRAAAGPDNRMLACLDLKGEPTYFQDRPATFEEIQWSVFAVIGADFDGLVWRRELVGSSGAARFGRLQAKLRPHTTQLGLARSVGWVRETQGLPCSAVATDETLYICALHPQYMAFTADGASIKLPLAPKDTTFKIDVRPPTGVVIESASTLGGMAVEVQKHNQHWRIEHELSGGGQVLVCVIGDAQSN